MKTIASISESIKDITAETVTGNDSAAINAVEDALAAVDTTNATQAEKDELAAAQDKIDSINSILTDIKEIENMKEDITDADEIVDAIEDEAAIPDNEEAVDAAIGALDNYHKLDDRQKELLGEDLKQILDEALVKITAYEIIKGANGKYTKESFTDLEFIANGIFKLFKEIRVDGRVIDSDHYTVVKGSTVVTLKADYLESISAGKHTLEVVYNVQDTDYIADCEFNVEKIPELTKVQKWGYQAIKVSWNKVNGTSGYYLYYREQETSTWKYVAQIGKGSTLCYTHKGLESGKTYEYRMRAYRTVDGEKVFGAYSVTKTGTTK